MNQYEMKKLAYQSNLRNRALQLLLYLIDRINKERTCFPAVRPIASELHISVSTVKRAMQELVESGYVTKESRFREENGGQTSNLYTLYFSKKPEEEGKTVEQEEAEQLPMKQSEGKEVCSAEAQQENLKKCQRKQADKKEIYGMDTMHGRVDERDTFLGWTGEEVSLIPP